MILAILALVTATYRPAAPTVGDPIAIDFPAPVVLDASRDYEVVSQQGRRVVVRTFAPRPFALSGTIGTTRFRNLIVPVVSVIKPNDDRKPAPLVAPRAAAYPRAPFLYIALAALCALAVWLLVWRRSRRAVAAPEEPALPADERFRRAIAALRANPSRPKRWALLADETRALLAATRPHLGSDLTTSELLPRVAGDERELVEAILRQGDLEKFSPAGAAPRDFDALAARALELIPKPLEEERAA
ncbi:MAG TPA: hypothetical protein VF824_17840 [Thermoanaerobaculia bacterium]|jgi:hypothetical protein